MMKVPKYCLYDSKGVLELKDEEDENPTNMCTNNSCLILLTCEIHCISHTVNYYDTYSIDFIGIILTI